ncbi:MAG: hypothetical protein ACFBSF_12895 [Leptolyngbyaceae cyanobacterium]
MFLFWVSIFFILAVPILIGFVGWVGYSTGKSIVGREAANRNVRYAISYLLILFLLSLLLGEYKHFLFGTLLLLGIIYQFGIWFFQIQNLGDLLLSIKNTYQDKSVFRAGIFFVFLTIFRTGALVWDSNESLQDFDLISRMVEVIFGWLVTSYLILLGLSPLEFRENGISFMYFFISWTRMKSFIWEESKPNTLTIWFKPRFFFLPGFISIPIPEKYREAATQILHEKVHTGRHSGSWFCELLSREDVGSSANTSLGWLARARAIATSQLELTP